MTAAKKQPSTATSTSRADILARYDEAHGRYYLKHAKKFASFPELLGMQEK